MTLFQALVIGIIQGLTEFLPISSTAHIRIVPELAGWNDPGAAFTAVIQWGTLVAALLYFRRDIATLTRAFLTELFSGRFARSYEGKMAWMIVLGTLPIVVLGLVFKKQIETSLRSLYVISGSLILFALTLLLAEWMVRFRERTLRKQKTFLDLSWSDTIAVGFAQAVALIPGASRSGVTITGGLLVGMTRETAARYSFLLSLPAVFGAGVFELYKERHELLATGTAVTNLVVSTIVSGIVGYATIAFLLSYLKRHTTYIFIAYRFALGGLLLALLLGGRLHPLPEADSDIGTASSKWQAKGECISQNNGSTLRGASKLNRLRRVFSYKLQQSVPRVVAGRHARLGLLDVDDQRGNVRISHFVRFRLEAFLVRSDNLIDRLCSHSPPSCTGRCPDAKSRT
jgi:undecaprenyl-diphosphatase